MPNSAIATDRFRETPHCENQLPAFAGVGLLINRYRFPLDRVHGF